MTPRNTVENIDVFLSMLRHDKPTNKNAELFLECIGSDNISSANYSKITEAIKTKTHYSRMGIYLYNPVYDSNLEKVINAINESSSKIELKLSYFHGDKGALLKTIIKMITNKSCPKELTIILNNCQINDTEIALFSEALSSGHCPQGLRLKFNNVDVHIRINNRIINGNDITNDGIRAIIAAIRSTQCPRDLQIDFSHNIRIDAVLIDEMNQLLVENNKIQDKKHDALACVTLQQGLTQKKSILNKLPQDVANIIYEQILPKQTIFKTFKEIRESKQIEENKSAIGCIML